ncbi:MAG: YdeI/OmpD-associated family protein [Patescibacteria group bacterium]
MPKKLAPGVVHTIPPDLRAALVTKPAIADAWNNLTPLARNEWICWTVSVKKAETRQQHIDRIKADLQNGKRRPCCWAGCPHR